MQVILNNTWYNAYDADRTKRPCKEVFLCQFKSMVVNINETLFPLLWAIDTTK